MKRYKVDTETIILRWTDTVGQFHRRLFGSHEWSEAHKALRWLGDNGCRDADLALPAVEIVTEE